MRILRLSKKAKVVTKNEKFIAMKTDQDKIDEKNRSENVGRILLRSGCLTKLPLRQSVLATFWGSSEIFGALVYQSESIINA